MIHLEFGWKKWYAWVGYIAHFCVIVGELIEICCLLVKCKKWKPSLIDWSAAQSWCFPSQKGWCVSNVVKTIVNHPFGNALYMHIAPITVVIWGMVCYCFNYMKPKSVASCPPPKSRRSADELAKPFGPLGLLCAQSPGSNMGNSLESDGSRGSQPIINSVVKPVSQALVNVPCFKMFNSTFESFVYLLEIVLPIVGWCERFGHVPTPVISWAVTETFINHDVICSWDINIYLYLYLFICLFIIYIYSVYIHI